MSLKQQLTEDMKTAMKAGEKDRLGVIRLINAAIKQREVDERIELDDAAVLAVLEKMVKQRKDSVSQYEGAGREDLAAIERAELAIIDTYLPAKLDEAAIAAAIDAAIAQTGAAGPADMGKLMGVLKPQLAGQADMAWCPSWSSRSWPAEPAPRRAACGPRAVRPPARAAIESHSHLHFPGWVQASRRARQQVRLARTSRGSSTCPLPLTAPACARRC